MDRKDIKQQDDELAEQLKGSRLETIAEGVSAVVAAAPWIGGPLTAVISGRVTDRKLQRVNDALVFLAGKLKAVGNTLEEDYVRSEEFEDLLDEVLPRISRERSQRKRNLYALYLKGVLTNVEQPYDEKLNFLNALDQLQFAHIEVLNAFLQKPDNEKIFSGFGGSRIQTLRNRLQNYNEATIEELVIQLNDLRLTDAKNLKTMMSSDGAENLRSVVTPMGQRFYSFLLNE